jgi:hypothetical protein
VTDGMREYLRWQDRCLSPQQIAGEIYRESPLVHPSVMLRRQALRAAGGYREGPFPEDYELWLRLVQAGRRLAKVPQLLLEWRLSDTSWSRVSERCSRQAFDRIRAEYLASDPRLRGSRPLVVWGAGRRTRRRSDLLLGRVPAPLAYVDIDPHKIGRRHQGIPVVDPDWLQERTPRPFVLIYVTRHGAPELVAARLQAMGFEVGRDYLSVG